MGKHKAAYKQLLDNTNLEICAANDRGEWLRVQGTANFDNSPEAVSYTHLINTASLRAAESFVEQDTVLFHDSIEENVKIANRNATHEQVVAACKKASIHDFIMTLPQGYDTPVDVYKRQVRALVAENGCLLWLVSANDNNIA